MTEQERIQQMTDDWSGWRRWGCYVSERSWGTVREDYSAHGDAWNYLPHDQARSKAYRWGEDAIAGICDRYQFLIFAPAFWNHHDPILKERLFGLTNSEGNHGEDVKEYYFHLDNTPTHSYMRYLYRYPQRAYPYEQLIRENSRRSIHENELELIDTGVLDENRFFDITIEYAKVSTEDLAIRITAHNCGPESAPLDVLPHLWFRNNWSWGERLGTVPVIRRHAVASAEAVAICADGLDLANEPTARNDYPFGPRVLYGQAEGRLLFTNNETNMPRVYGESAKNRTPFVKDAFHRQIVGGEACTNPAEEGSKATLHYRTVIPAGGSQTWILRLSDQTDLREPLAGLHDLIDQRRREADDFYAGLHPETATADERAVQRQAWAGLLWTKQSYLFDVQRWLEGDNPQYPPAAERQGIRNQHWRHLNSLRVMLVPDKWEYPWFAAWDLAFHSVAYASIDPRGAMDQLWMLLFEQFQHASGQLPAYEWEFSDVNPPVHAWAVWRVYQMARTQWNITDRDFLERCFHKLLINFAWWVNRVDREGNNIFEGGFLGLDNITVLDRSTPLPGGSVLEQSDATGWMGMFCLNLMRIALELAQENPVYEGLAIKFFQHYVYVAAAMKHMGGRSYRLWDDDDGFFYDVLRHPDGAFQKFRVRSLVGLIPLFAVERLEENWLNKFPRFRDNVQWFMNNRRELVKEVVQSTRRDDQDILVLTIVNDEQLRQILQRVADPDEFMSAYGVRSLSKYHAQHPFEFGGNQVGYEPGESTNRIKGGNSNWRGPIWLPTNFLLVESLKKLAKAWGDDFVIPAGDQTPYTLGTLARTISQRLVRLFTRDEEGRRATYGANDRWQHDPAWRDLPAFYEYFNGDTGDGLGASHQTGWTALVATLIAENGGPKNS
ncbi:MAG: MGH1-like glycoside hydrolase domain-containing protein [Planctomycetota bacterium]